MLLDLGSHVRVVSLFIEHAQVSAGEGFRIHGVHGADGDAYDVGVTVQLLGYAAAFLHTVAVGDDLRAADADFHWEIAPADPMDLIDSHDGEATAILRALTAPFVRAPVLLGTEPVLKGP